MNRTSSLLSELDLHYRVLLICVVCLTLGACCARPLIMPDSGYRANIVALDPPLTMLKSEKRQLRVKLTNQSDLQWITSGTDPNDLWRCSDSGQYRMMLGNHWVKSDDATSHEDGRAELPERFDPMESSTILLTVKAPVTAGDYILELDVVQENVTWFAAKGSTTARYPIRVE